MNADRRLREYETLPLFAGCTRSELRRVSAVATRLTVGAGTVLARRGHRARQFVIVLSGTAEVWRDGRRIDEIGPGGSFGEIALVRRIGEPAGVVARGAMTLDVIGSREFATLYADLAPVRRSLDRELDRRVTTWLRASDGRSPRTRVPMVWLSSFEPFVRSELP
jgi:CRP-like cAMP-binding protein